MVLHSFNAKSLEGKRGTREAKAEHLTGDGDIGGHLTLNSKDAACSQSTRTFLLRISHTTTTETLFQPTRNRIGPIIYDAKDFNLWITSCSVA
ncbi:hypothetical protein Y032_0138g2067 [Ancylostoma ceylanicum]|nr:hypothetical protein Y032_0138g2067 [Ancylostoma ceylanicum]